MRETESRERLVEMLSVLGVFVYKVGSLPRGGRYNFTRVDVFLPLSVPRHAKLTTHPQGVSGSGTCPQGEVTAPNRSSSLAFDSMCSV